MGMPLFLIDKTILRCLFHQTSLASIFGLMQNDFHTFRRALYATPQQCQHLISNGNQKFPLIIKICGLISFLLHSSQFHTA